MTFKTGVTVSTTPMPTAPAPVLDQTGPYDQMVSTAKRLGAYATELAAAEQKKESEKIFKQGFESGVGGANPYEGYNDYRADVYAEGKEKFKTKWEAAQAAEAKKRAKKLQERVEKETYQQGVKAGVGARNPYEQDDYRYDAFQEGNQDLSEWKLQSDLDLWLSAAKSDPEYKANPEKFNREWQKRQKSLVGIADNLKRIEINDKYSLKVQNAIIDVNEDNASEAQKLLISEAEAKVENLTMLHENQARLGQPITEESQLEMNTLLMGLAKLGEDTTPIAEEIRDRVLRGHADAYFARNPTEEAIQAFLRGEAFVTDADGNPTQRILFPNAEMKTIASQARTELARRQKEFKAQRDAAGTQREQMRTLRAQGIDPSPFSVEQAKAAEAFLTEEQREFNNIVDEKALELFETVDAAINSNNYAQIAQTIDNLNELKEFFSLYPSADPQGVEIYNEMSRLHDESIKAVKAHQKKLKDEPWKTLGIEFSEDETPNEMAAKFTRVSLATGNPNPPAPESMLTALQAEIDTDPAGGIEALIEVRNSLGPARFESAVLSHLDKMPGAYRRAALRGSDPAQAATVYRKIQAGSKMQLDPEYAEDMKTVLSKYLPGSKSPEKQLKTIAYQLVGGGYGSMTDDIVNDAIAVLKYQVEGGDDREPSEILDEAINDVTHGLNKYVDHEGRVIATYLDLDQEKFASLTAQVSGSPADAGLLTTENLSIRANEFGRIYMEDRDGFGVMDYRGNPVYLTEDGYLGIAPFVDTVGNFNYQYGMSPIKSEKEIPDSYDDIYGSAITENLTPTYKNRVQLASIELATQGFLTKESRSFLERFDAFTMPDGNVMEKEMRDYIFSEYIASGRQAYDLSGQPMSVLQAYSSLTKTINDADKLSYLSWQGFSMSFSNFGQPLPPDGSGGGPGSGLPKAPQVSTDASGFAGDQAPIPNTGATGMSPATVAAGFVGDNAPVGQPLGQPTATELNIDWTAPPEIVSNEIWNAPLRNPRANLTTILSGSAIPEPVLMTIDPVDVKSVFEDIAYVIDSSAGGFAGNVAPVGNPIAQPTVGSPIEMPIEPTRDNPGRVPGTSATPETFAASVAPAGAGVPGAAPNIVDQPMAEPNAQTQIEQITGEVPVDVQPEVTGETQPVMSRPSMLSAAEAGMGPTITDQPFPMSLPQPNVQLEITRPELLPVVKSTVELAIRSLARSPQEMSEMERSYEMPVPGLEYSPVDGLVSTDVDPHLRPEYADLSSLTMAMETVVDTIVEARELTQVPTQAAPGVQIAPETGVAPEVQLAPADPNVQTAIEGGVAPAMDVAPEFAADTPVAVPDFAPTQPSSITMPPTPEMAEAVVTEGEIYIPSSIGVVAAIAQGIINEIESKPELDGFVPEDIPQPDFEENDPSIVDAIIKEAKLTSKLIEDNPRESLEAGILGAAMLTIGRLPVVKRALQQRILKRSKSLAGKYKNLRNPNRTMKTDNVIPFPKKPGPRGARTRAGTQAPDRSAAPQPMRPGRRAGGGLR